MFSYQIGNDSRSLYVNDVETSQLHPGETTPVPKRCKLYPLQ